MDEIPPANNAIEEVDHPELPAEDETTKTKKPSGKTSVLGDVLRLILKVLVIVLVFMLMFTFLFGFFRLHGDAMDPNFKDGDLIIYYRLDKRYVATNCVAYRYDDQTMVGRVVAVAGDTVDLTDDGLVINGALQSEPDPTKDTLPFKEGTSYPVKLEEGEVFLLGDDRPNAVDSRNFGPVEAKETLGEIMTVIRSEP